MAISSEKKKVYKTPNGQTDYSLAGKPNPLGAVEGALPLAASLLQYRWKNWLLKCFSHPQLSRGRDPKSHWKYFSGNLSCTYQCLPTAETVLFFLMRDLKER